METQNLLHEIESLIQSEMPFQFRIVYDMCVTIHTFETLIFLVHENETYWKYFLFLSLSYYYDQYIKNNISLSLEHS